MIRERRRELWAQQTAGRNPEMRTHFQCTTGPFTPGVTIGATDSAIRALRFAVQRVSSSPPRALSFDRTQLGEYLRKAVVLVVVVAPFLGTLVAIVTGRNRAP